MRRKENEELKDTQAPVTENPVPVSAGTPLNTDTASQDDMEKKYEENKNRRAHGLVVMTLLSRGRDRSFKSGWAHLLKPKNF